MNKENYLVILFDYYGDLLKDKQREYFINYYFNNLSLGEIASSMSVSRNAVSKQLKLIENKLYFYEDKLKLYDKDQKLLKVIDSLDESVKNKIKKVFDLK